MYLETVSIPFWDNVLISMHWTVHPTHHTTTAHTYWTPHCTHEQDTTCVCAHVDTWTHCEVPHVEYHMQTNPPIYYDAHTHTGTHTTYTQKFHKSPLHSKTTYSTSKFHKSNKKKWLPNTLGSKVRDYSRTHICPSNSIAMYSAHTLTEISPRPVHKGHCPSQRVCVPSSGGGNVWSYISQAHTPCTYCICTVQCTHNPCQIYTHSPYAPSTPPANTVKHTRWTQAHLQTDICPRKSLCSKLHGGSPTQCGTTRVEGSSLQFT